MIFFFTIIFCFFSFFNSKYLKNIVNGFNIVFFPYLVIVLLNNYLWKNVFYSINNDSLFVMSIAMVIYEIAFLMFRMRVKTHIYRNVEKIEIINKMNASINYKFVEVFISIVIAIRLIGVILIYARGGIIALSANNFSSLDVGIITGRLLICLYPAGWIAGLRLFSNYNLNKRKKSQYILYCILIVFSLFMSTVKTHAMIFVLGLYIIAIYCDKNNCIKGLLILIFLIVFLFFCNYAIRWLSIDSTVPTIEYTIRHFWKYVAGGTINLNGVISEHATYNFFDFWTQVFSPIPNEFLFSIGKSISITGTIAYIKSFPLVSFANYMEYSNVVNLFGFMYGNGNLLGYIVNISIFSIVTEICLNKFYMSNKLPSLLLSISLLNYSFLSFFSLYYGTSQFWQIIFYTYFFTIIVTTRWKI